MTDNDTLLWSLITSLLFHTHTELMAETHYLPTIDNTVNLTLTADAIAESTRVDDGASVHQALRSGEASTRVDPRATQDVRKLHHREDDCRQTHTNTETYD